MMPEDPQVPQLPDPVDEPMTGETAPSQPPESPLAPELLPGESEPAAPAKLEAPAGRAGAPKEEGADYVSEIRQSLQSEESSAKTGGFIRRITGSLRRVTGPLRKQTGPLPEAPPVEKPEQPVIPTEVADDFLTGRLSGAPAEEAIPLPPPEEGFPEGFFDELPAGEGGDALESLFAEEAQLDTSSVLSELGMTEQSEAEALEPDWMAEIRLETADEEPPSAPEVPAAPLEPEAPPQPEKPRARGSGPLSFITGILRGPEERRKRKQTDELPDDLVTGRLERSQGTAPIHQKPPEPPAPETPIPFEDLFPEDGDLSEIPPALRGTPDILENPRDGLTLEELAAGTDAVPLFAEDDFGLDEDTSLLEGLESRFGQFGEDTGEPVDGLQAQENLDALAQETDLTGIILDEEPQLWSEEQAVEGAAVESPLFAPEDVWGEEELPATDEPGPRAGISIDDALAASFLTGEDIQPDLLGYSTDQLLREALERSADSGEITSFEEMRAIALQGYQEGAPLVDEVSAYAEEAAEPLSEEEVARAAAEDAEAEKSRLAAAEATAAVVDAWEREEQESGPFSLRRWLATRTLVQKFLLVEGLVVALAVLVAVPFFIYLIARGPAQKLAGNDYESPTSLAAHLPYPTGLQLPGGWRFQLQKSTYQKGQWTPSTSEWLEGTELRRVVALPWNAQTQAVVKTFQPGDTVLVDLSNGQTVEYTVNEVERVAASNTQILSDPRPSLVIILFQEESTERWVVICEPQRN